MRTNLMLLVLLLLTACTWALGTANFRYVGGSDIAFDGRFPGNLERWRVSGTIQVSDTHLTMTPNPDGESRARWQVSLPPNPGSSGMLDQALDAIFSSTRLLQIRYYVETLKPPGVLPGRARPARIATWLIDHQISTKPFRYLPSVTLSGQTRIQRGVAYAAIPDGTDEIELVLMSLESNGEFRLSHLEARIVYETVLYRSLLLLGMLVWCGFAILLAVGIVRRAGKKVAFLIGAALAMIIVGVLMPENIRIEPVRRLFAFLGGLAGGVGDKASMLFAYKIGHFVFFALATAAGLLFRQRLSILQWQVVAFFLLMAAATEGMQLHLLGRSTRVMDLIIDSAGVLLAVGVLSLWMRWKRRRSANGVTGRHSAKRH